MSTLRRLVWRAYELFTSDYFIEFLSCPRVLPKAFEEIVENVADMSLSELNLTPEIINQFKYKSNDPVLYMPIVDGEFDALIDDEGQPIASVIRPDPANVMTVAVFFVKPGARLPLHNHPKMLGIMKALCGEIHVQSYSSIERVKLPERRGFSETIVEKNPMTVLTKDSSPVVLLENSGDIHEIHNLSNEMACFFDILAPPYDFRRHDESDPVFAHRYISYYRESTVLRDDSLASYGLPKDTSKTYCVLREISCPRDYTCAHISYRGPSLAK